MTNDAIPSLTAAERVAKDDTKARAPNPKRHFASPELLAANQELSDDEKYALLKEWDLEINNRLKAEEEGMSAHDPIRSQHEAKLDDEAARVRSHLAEFASKTGAA